LGSDLSLEIIVRRDKYRSRLSKNLFEVIQRQIGAITEEELSRIKDDAKVTARESRKDLSSDPERYSDHILNHLKTDLLRTAVSPLIDQLDTFFENQGSDGYENVYNLEEELGERLIEQISEPMASAIAEAIVDNQFDRVDELIDDACDPVPIRRSFVSYFENLTTGDFFQELTELRSTLKLKDNFQIYIYACAVRFGQSRYPLFYFPVEVSLSASTFTVRADPHLFINKKAIDFASGEISRDIGHHVSLPLPERIIYLSQGDRFLTVIQTLLDDLTATLSLNGSIDLTDFGSQKSSRSQIVIDNSLHFAAFDQSDESLLNDYEELLQILDSESEAADDFIALVKNFMFSESQSFEDTIDKEWGELPLPDRLVYESPVPLNEEQRKILRGLNSDGCRFIAVEGPPGTGKSHTITACVFDAILNHKNVLVLSDKKEALDVVENKIRQTLKTVRLSERVQDPILRLGKQGSTYTKILAPKTIQQLKQSHQVALRQSSDLDKAIAQKENSIKTDIEEVDTTSKAIAIQEIAQSQRNEREFEEVLDDAEGAFSDPCLTGGILAAKQIGDFTGNSEIRVLLDVLGEPLTIDSLDDLLEIQQRINSGAEKVKTTHAMRFFKGFSVGSLSRLGQLIREYQNCRSPLFGFLFSKSRARDIDRQFGSEFECVSAIDAHKHFDRLQKAEEGIRAAISDLKLARISKPSELNLALFQYLRNITINSEDINSTQNAIDTLRSSLEQDQDDDFEAIGITLENLEDYAEGSSSPVRTRLEKVALHCEHINEITRTFEAVPEMDYSAELEKLEQLQTRRLADTIDGRVVNFANTRKNVAAQIKTIIRKKQKFPKDLFEVLQEAFPIIISGIRDYAEYVPLEHGLFDIVIIDEASQVSIAQALPSFVRAKKVLVLGDRNQFSNVKTVNASIATNQNYKSLVLEKFRDEEHPNEAMLNQIKMFDIKTSVLDFIDHIANLKIMLRKHFRGYPDLIGFSSEYFYEGALQAVKIRGKPIDDVIQFAEVENDGLLELQGNINGPETAAIIKELGELSKMEEPPDVCVITPHTEQQRHIWNSIQKRTDSSNLIDKLKLRVFTFDTCQGEEAHTILYSMVATENRDKLNYIFAKDMENSGDVEDVLRLQRLNVGFSRAKERVCFFHSKPINEFSGSIGTALSHFYSTLEEGRKGPDISDTDPSSPMEAEVLHWLREAPLIDQLGENVEIDAQFELGQYLKQLDPTYTHPAYRVDFLLKVRGPKKDAQIIIEYDGLKEHFENLPEVDASNCEAYMKSEDVERQKILESYGYRFLRINRFNKGSDPVRTLDERLRKIVDQSIADIETPKLIEEHRQQQQSLADGKSKVCSRCKAVQLLSQFFDQTLSGGQGSYGRICIHCKGNKTATRRWRPYWRTHASLKRRLR